VCRSGKIDWENISNSLQSSQNAKLDVELEYLKSHGDLLTQLVDQQGYTLIIHAVLQGQPGKVGYLIKKTIELEKASLDTIKEWVRKRDTEEGFSALHYAAYKSNLDACATLLRYGADIDAISTYGLSILHVASQTNSAAPLYFFKELGVDINLRDKSGTTALQWAIFSSAEISAAYLLAWNPKVDEQNDQGQTALHTAVK